MEYPIKVLKKKLRRPDYLPIVVDMEKQAVDTLHLKNEKVSPVKDRVITGVAASIAAVALFAIIVAPVTETGLAKASISNVVNEFAEQDAEVINSLRYDYELLSELSDRGTVSIVITGNEDDMSEAALKALTITTIKEVMTDGESLQVKFTSEQ